jgi:hypothetical protein
MHGLTDQTVQIMYEVYTQTLVMHVQGGSNMTGTCAACLHTNQSRSYLNHLVLLNQLHCFPYKCTVSI